MYVTMDEIAMHTIFKTVYLWSLSGITPLI